MDSLVTLRDFLNHAARAKQRHMFPREYHKEQQLLKLLDRMYAMLSIVVSLTPQHLDENLQSVLRDKFGDTMSKMQQG